MVYQIQDHKKSWQRDSSSFKESVGSFLGNGPRMRMVTMIHLVQLLRTNVMDDNRQQTQHEKNHF